ncbi:endonuclease/exonuclease/phosphatase family protein [Bordetella bronchialis]|uniref:Endonuclease n=1 Tax=Bordetella bronchialis TaxID=463025 RepID=A0A193FD55_9BORD|nr:endonuclease/exonuclease/phosphatase family protein [Bordetella bronchialis]ANN65208.1 endonuclease [Bordetella bronchialis]ANN70241.1 endonuclease [Bordetella bronchialis]
MRLVNWNIQWGRGVDGSVDLRRIVDHARRLADFDVLCLQEVTRGFHGDADAGGLPGGPDADQFAELGALLPGYTVLCAIGADLPPARAGAPRRQNGNAIVTRCPVGPVFRHSLPWPADPAVMSMPRVALEAVLSTDVGPLRVVTTHLEFYSADQRLAQAHALRDLHVEACGHAGRPSPHGNPNGPFAAVERPAAALVCGDFNSAVTDAAYRCMLDPMPAGVPSFVDAWRVAHGEGPRAPTVGVHDHVQWPQGPFACDFVFVTPELAGRLVRCDVDLQSAASDHQPIVVEFR